MKATLGIIIFGSLISLRGEASVCSRLAELLSFSHKSTYYQTLYQEFIVGDKQPDEATKVDVAKAIERFEKKKRATAELGFAYLIMFKYYGQDDYLLKIMHFRQERVDIDLSIEIDRALAGEAEKKGYLNPWR